MFLLMFSTVQMPWFLLHPKTIILCCEILGPHVSIKIMVSWDMAPCSLKGRYQSFVGICNFCLQDKRRRHQLLPKRGHPSTALYSIMSQKTAILTLCVFQIILINNPFNTIRLTLFYHYEI